MQYILITGTGRPQALGFITSAAIYYHDLLV